MGSLEANESRAKLNVIENQQDREDSGRDLEPERRKEHEQEELEKEANSVHIGLKVTESEQERALLPLLSMPVCHSSGVICLACATKQLNHVFLSLRMPIMFHPDRRTQGQTDTWTHGQTNFR